MTITFCLVPSIPLGVLRECSGFNRFPYSILNYENKLWDMKHYSCSRPISYNFTILVHYFQGQRNDLTIFELLILECYWFKTHRVFRTSKLLAGSKTLFLINDIIANESLDKRRQPLLELSILGRHRNHSLWLLT